MKGVSPPASIKCQTTSNLKKQRPRMCRKTSGLSMTAFMLAAFLELASSFTFPNGNRARLRDLSHVMCIDSIHLRRTGAAESALGRFEKRNTIELHSDKKSTSLFSLGTKSGSAEELSRNAAENVNNARTRRTQKRKKYERKRDKTPSEKERDKIRKSRQAEYEQLRSSVSGNVPPSVWTFEALFPEPVWDDQAIYRDLFEIIDRDKLQKKASQQKGTSAPKIDTVLTRELAKMKTTLSGSSRIRTFRPPKLNNDLPYDPPPTPIEVPKVPATSVMERPIIKSVPGVNLEYMVQNITNTKKTAPVIDRALTRMVEDRLYGYRRTQDGDFQYETSLMGDGAVKFRDGVRLGNALKVNCDRLNYHAKKQVAKGKLEEAEELYEKAIEINPKDGRAYLGLSRVAQRRRDFAYAKECLRAGLANSINALDESPRGRTVHDQGANPFLLQALGCLEERMGNLAQAEALYIAAAKSRPSHAAAWVSLAQLRTRKLSQGASAGRVCYQTAERELKLAGLPASSHVYTAWASLESSSGDARRARELYLLALDIDPKCSAAWLQLGVMETASKNWGKAKECFETVLKYDQRNSRVLQTYALMEGKRPNGNSRKVIGLFEEALKVNPKDAGVLQAYALYVAKLGDIGAARTLLRRGTQVDTRHAPVWQAWGVLETRHGTAEVARDVFQQGIWACAQSSGGQSGGRRCARLWQAWGVLEAREGDHSAARRCFSRALDADTRNVAAVTAWTLMEAELGNYKDARLIFERALKQFPASSDEKVSLWRAYEVMETKSGNLKAAQQVYQRSMRDTMAVRDDVFGDGSEKLKAKINTTPSIDSVSQKNSEVEVVSWKSNSEDFNRDVWMKDGSIEGKVPSSTMKKKPSKQTKYMQSDEQENEFDRKS